MKDDEILRAAREQAKNTMGEYEASEERKGLMLAMVVGVIICTIMIVIELIAFRRLEYGKPALLLAVYSTVNIRLGIKGENKKYLITGIVMGVLAAVFLLLYIGAFVK